MQDRALGSRFLSPVTSLPFPAGHACLHPSVPTQPYKGKGIKTLQATLLCFYFLPQILFLMSSGPVLPRALSLFLTECVLTSNNLALTLVPGSSLLIVHTTYMLMNSVSLPALEK